MHNGAMRGAMIRGLALLGLCCATPARADCPAANRYELDFSPMAFQQLSYASTYSWNATNGLGQSASVGVGFAVYGASSTIPNTRQMPRIENYVNDGNPVTAASLLVGMVLAARTADLTQNTNAVVTTFTLPFPVRDLRIQLNDIDFSSNQFRDWVKLTGTNGASSYIPSITTPFGNNNGSGARTATGSTVNLGSATTPLAVAVDEAMGTALSVNTTNNGTIYAEFAQPVNGVTFRYGNSGQSAGGTTTGPQVTGIQRISFCPMPAVTVTKTSAPWSDPANGTTNPKLIPGADLIYTLTVTNANASNLSGADLPALADVLPSTITFYNGDIDDAGPLTGNFEFVPGTSGLTLTSANIAYSSNGGSTYAYTPAAGYDAAVNAIRFAPTSGTQFNANSSFSIRFRARIK
jgi:hypothetical protein